MSHSLPHLLRTALGALVVAAALGTAGCTSDGRHATDPPRSPTAAPSRSDDATDDTTGTPAPTGDAAPRPFGAITPDTIRSAPNTLVFDGGLAVEPNSLAARAADRLTADGDADAARAAELIAERPVALWLGDGHDDAALVDEITDYLVAAEIQDATPVFVTYAIPDRDCGNYSAGGLAADDYPAWNQLVADTLRGHRAVVIVEPDSLGMLTRCPDLAEERIPLIRESVAAFSDAGVPAYLDGGNSNWVPAREMAERLEQAGIDRARGFYTNVASFYPVDDERAYAERVSELTGDSRYVIDVSRNGQGWRGTWCNPEGAGLGQDPHVTGGSKGLDAFLWVKTPGISDGTCNGGPPAGEWWASFAEGLVERRSD
jgi:endoglucanase